MKRLILVRHGNTFEAHEKARFVGRKENLPLTSFGIEQAQKLGTELKKQDIFPDKIIEAGLKRTGETAQILCDILAPHLSVELDSRLLEISYGTWAGLTERQVIDRFGERTLMDFREHGVWPTNADFSPSIDQVISETRDVLDSVSEGTTLAVSSNGRIRWYGNPRSLSMEKPESGSSVKTGSYSILEYHDSEWVVLEWNVLPK